MLRQYRLKDYNFRLIIWVIALSVIGILVIGSAKESRADKTDRRTDPGTGGYGDHFTDRLQLGFGFLLAFLFCGYRDFLPPCCLPVKMWVVQPRWIRVGGVLQFQPSDVVKILMIAFFAKFFQKHEEDTQPLQNDPDLHCFLWQLRQPCF